MSLTVALAIGLSLSRPFWLGSSAGLLAIVVYVAGLGSPRGTWWRLALAGVSAALTVLVRFNFGAYVAAVVCADLVLEEARAANWIPAKVRLRRLLLQFCLFGAVILLCNLLFYAALYRSQMAFAVFRMVASAKEVLGPLRFVALSWRQGWVVAWPCIWVALREILRAGRLSGKSLLALIPAPILLAVLVVGQDHPATAVWLTLIGAIAVVFLYVAVGGFDRVEFCLLLYFVFNLHYYLVRADVYHAETVFPVLVLLIPYLLMGRTSAADEGAHYGNRSLALIALVIGIWMGVFGPGEPTPIFSLFASGLRSLPHAVTRLSDADRLAAHDLRSPWVINSVDQNESKVIAFIRQRTAADDPLFVGVRDHSQVFVNDTRLYWLTGRTPGTRYIELDAGMASRAEEQQLIISDLNRNRVKWAVLEDTTGVGDGRFLRLVRPDSRLLDEFLAANYGEVASFGTFAIRQRTTAF
jgi:hypothetical protein